MTRRWPFALASAALHVALILSAATTCAERQAGHPPPPPPPVKHEPVEMVFIPPGMGAEQCPGYSGIGVRHAWGVVNSVAPGSPAERAGIREGDIVNGHYRGLPIGTRVTVHYERDGIERSVVVFIQHICEERETP